MESTVKLYSLSFKNVNTYLWAFLLVTSNVIFPQLCHLVHLGGPTLLPIYFFTLVGAYKYGMKVGLLSALFSPLVNHFLFGMPSSAVLPAILIKSVLLAVIAGYVAVCCKRVSLLALLIVVSGYQLIGTLGEWALTSDFYVAVQDFRIGIPGILLQIFGGYFFLKTFIRK